MFGGESCGPYSFCAASSVLYIHKTLVQKTFFDPSSSLSFFPHPQLSNIFYRLIFLIRFNYLQSPSCLFISNIPDTARCFANTIV